ncbi:hypothetical protein [Streptomyces durbertensis]|uniref:hypothetical protein n=1 Tax=Streptomyces durbertensis TaxID=2448886 RepID=UPI002B216E75|nr:hypothetical protein [Streptomyces durbertensis]
MAALGRFQQMALLGLDRMPAVDWDRVVVVGSGPVALGMVLELRRRGVGRVRVVTSRVHTAIDRAPWVECVSHVSETSVVIDAVGNARRAASMLSPGGILGLLGTPDDTETLAAVDVHRRGWTVVGMHELAPAAAPHSYRSAYTEATTWLSEHLDPALLKFWCRTVPGNLAPEIYQLLGTPRRPAEPVTLFDWRATS